MPNSNVWIPDPEETSHESSQDSENESEESSQSDRNGKYNPQN